MKAGTEAKTDGITWVAITSPTAKDTTEVSMVTGSETALNLSNIVNSGLV